MDSNNIMSTSVLQYLDNIRSIIKENDVSKSNFELSSNNNLLDDQDDFQGVEFDNEQGQNFIFDRPDDQLDEDTLNFAHKLSINEEPTPNEEDKYDESLFEDAKDSNSKSDSKTDSSITKDAAGKKTRVSNKDRARKARQRKKKYYEDLEKRVEYLEKKTLKLTKENDYLTQKLKIYENGTSELKPTSEDACGFQGKIFDDIKKKLENISDDTPMMQAFSEMSNKFGPFGCQKKKIMENSFNMIIENMLCGEGIKLQLYGVDKNIPETREEYERYTKMKKYQQYEEYPDPLVRNYIEAVLSYGYNKDQFNHIIKNQKPALIKLKQEIKNAISMLFDAREQIYRSMINYSCFKKYFMAAALTKIQFLNSLDSIRHSDLKISHQKIFDIKSREVEVEAVFEVHDPKAFLKLAVQNK